MASKFPILFTGWLLAGLALSPAAAQAQSGFTISRSQQDDVRIGMSASEVQKLLGRPARAHRYRTAPGPIWYYTVIGAPFGKTDFVIEFGPDEKVIASSELAIGNDRASN